MLTHVCKILIEHPGPIYEHQFPPSVQYIAFLHIAYKKYGVNIIYDLKLKSKTPKIKTNDTNSFTIRIN
jgi:hypothetical protein